MIVDNNFVLSYSEYGVTFHNMRGVFVSKTHPRFVALSLS